MNWFLATGATPPSWVSRRRAAAPDPRPSSRQARCVLVHPNASPVTPQCHLAGTPEKACGLAFSHAHAGGKALRAPHSLGAQNLRRPSQSVLAAHRHANDPPLVNGPWARADALARGHKDAPAQHAVAQTTGSGWPVEGVFSLSSRLRRATRPTAGCMRVRARP